VNGGKIFAKKGKDGCAVHHRGFKEEVFSLLFRQVTQLFVSVYHGPFISCDGVCACFEGSANVIDGWLASLGVERCCLKEHIGLRCAQPLANISWRRRNVRKYIPTRRSRFTQNVRIESCRRRKPTQAARSDPGNPPLNTVALLEFPVPVLEQANERTIYIPESQQTEIVSGD
jgi:hypothetical protein